MEQTNEVILPKLTVVTEQEFSDFLAYKDGGPRIVAGQFSAGTEHNIYPFTNQRTGVVVAMMEVPVSEKTGRELKSNRVHYLLKTPDNGPA